MPSDELPFVEPATRGSAIRATKLTTNFIGLCMRSHCRPIIVSRTEPNTFGVNDLTALLRFFTILAAGRAVASM
jgi:hypothetical protein